MTYPKAWSMWQNVSEKDQELAALFVRGRWATPDLVIAPDGEPYLYRWHVVSRNRDANVYLHLQVDSDPERPLHDHPWDNTSVILSGGYDEIYNPDPHILPWKIGDLSYTGICYRRLRKGDVVHRKASEAHRLILPDGFLYTMTLFSTGPHIRDWGFWFPEGWRSNTEVLAYDPETRKSIMTEESRG